MIEMELITAANKPSDLKVCMSCKSLNWYSNDNCVRLDCDNTLFTATTHVVIDRIKEDYDFYMSEECMTEKEVDHILIEV